VIAIVGGGFTGLALGLELERLGRDFVILEASGRARGVIRSSVVDGRTLDWGPQRIRMTAAMARLVHDVGLDAEVLTAPRSLDLFVYHTGRLRRVPFTPRSFLSSDIISPAAKLRLTLEPLTRGADPEERVAHYFTRKVGRELYDAVIAPLYGGLYGSDPADMVVAHSLMHALREFGVGRSLVLALLRRGGAIRPPAACSFTQGMQSLSDAMARRLGSRIRLNASVRSLQRLGHGWRVGLADDSLDVTDVVLTTPAQDAARLLGDAAPEAAGAIAQLRYNPLAVVHLSAEAALHGLGFQVALTERSLVLRGVTFNASLFARHGLYTAYLGGAHHPGVAEMDDETLGRRAADEFRICTGVDARVLSVAHERMPAWDVSWQAIARLSLPPGIHLAANWVSRPGLPGRLADAARTARALVGSSAA
jgi:oxygen-dependent protoporphyrinogen oxidase